MPSVQIKKFCNSISKRNDVQIKTMLDSDITNYFVRKNKVREEHWSAFLKKMSTNNIDLSILGNATFSSQFELDGKEFNFSIHTDTKIVNRITKNNKSVDSIFQIFINLQV